MSSMQRYRLAEPLTPEQKASLSNHHPVVQQVFFNRNLTSPETVSAWLEPPYETALNDPFALRDMEPAVERILAAIAANEKIVIYSDYDCDGIPGAVVAHDFFTEIGFTNFVVYIPHRHYEGFGFNETAASTLAAEGANLIITIDCGTNDVAAVAAAQQAGVDVVITDHHQATGELPKAVAVVNPAVSSDYPFPHLCGAAVIFKVVQALIARGNFTIAPGREKWWLDMVGLATIADMVSLTEENRTLAHYGLHVLRKSRRPGLRALLKAQRASQHHLTEDDIGFTIGPRINAASRMGEPLRAFQLLTATTADEASDHLAHLEQLNNERKGAVAAMTRAAHKKLAQLESDVPVIVLGDPEWRPSLVGLVANKLSEERGVPAFVWGRDGNGVLKGSCRSNGEVSLITLMDTAKQSFTEYGGHHFSGGFSVSEQAIHSLPADLVAAMQQLDPAAATVEPQRVDVALTSAELTPTLIRDVLKLGPFGVGNPKPLFLLTTTPTSVEVFGKTKEHTKIIVPAAGGTLEAIAFFKTPAMFGEALATNRECYCVVQPEQSYFMGRVQTRLRLVDVLPEPLA